MYIFRVAALALTLGMLTVTSASSAASIMVSWLTTTSPAPAASIIGSWSGSGTVRLTSGQVVPVSCRVRYERGNSVSKTFVLNAKCAAAEGTIVLYGRVSKRADSSFRGSLYGEQSKVSGKITISVDGNDQSVHMTGSRGTGSVNLRRL